MHVRALLSVLLLSALPTAGLGCAHEVTVRSEPAGADVYLLDEFGDGAELIGQAPVTVEVENGFIGGASTVVVADDSAAVQVTITRGRVTLESFTGAFTDMGVGMLCCGGVAAGAGALTWWLFPIVPWLVWPGVCLAGCAGLSTVVQPLGCAAGMWAPPDIVDVNLRSATASSLPGEMVDEVQRVEGPPPLTHPLRPDDDAPPAEPPRRRQQPPPSSSGGAIDIGYTPVPY